MPHFHYLTMHMHEFMFSLFDFKVHALFRRLVKIFLLSSYANKAIIINQQMPIHTIQEFSFTFFFIISSVNLLRGHKNVNFLLILWTRTKMLVRMSLSRICTTQTFFFILNTVINLYMDSFWKERLAWSKKFLIIIKEGLNYITCQSRCCSCSIRREWKRKTM